MIKVLQNTTRSHRSDSPKPAQHAPRSTGAFGSSGTTASSPAWAADWHTTASCEMRSLRKCQAGYCRATWAPHCRCEIPRMHSQRRSGDNSEHASHYHFRAVVWPRLSGKCSHKNSEFGRFNGSQLPLNALHLSFRVAPGEKLNMRIGRKSPITDALASHAYHLFPSGAIVTG